MIMGDIARRKNIAENKPITTHPNICAIFLSSINDIRKTIAFFRFLRRFRTTSTKEESNRKISGETHDDPAANNNLIAMNPDSPKITDQKDISGDDKSSDYKSKDCKHCRAKT
jgi:hypothetical protein